MESGNQNTPAKELSSHSEEDEGSHDSSEDRSSSNADSPKTNFPNLTVSGSLQKKQKLDTEKENVSSILPPFYNLQSSNISNIPSSIQPFSNFSSQANFQNNQQENPHTININLTSRQEVPSSSSEELPSINSPLAPKPSQRLNVVTEDFRGQTTTPGLLDRQGLHSSVTPFGIGFQSYPAPLSLNVAPLPNLSLTYPLPSFPPPQAQTTYYSPSPQYHIPLQYPMQPIPRSRTDSIHNPEQTSTNSRDIQLSNTDPKPQSSSQQLTSSSSDQVTSPMPSSGSINLSTSQPSSSSSSVSFYSSANLSTANPSFSRESTANQLPAQGEPPSLYLQSPYSSQSRTTPSISLPPTVRSTPDEAYYNWTQLPPVQLGRPSLYGHITYPSAVSLYPPYMGQLSYDTSGLSPLPAINIWQVPPSAQGMPSNVSPAPSNTNFSQRAPTTWQPSYLPHKRPAVEVPRTVSLVPTQHHRFELQIQPFSNQRKSYKNEKRYILPNPITICLKKKRQSDNNNNTNATSEAPDDVISGYVTVDLVDGLGNPIPNKDEIFASIDGTFSQTLSAEGVAQFSLKVLANSGPDKYRLLFRVVYTTRDGMTYEEQIPSQAFAVKSNKALKAKMAQEAQKENQPQILDLSANQGRPHRAVPVWIKAKGIINPIVYFGDRQAPLRDWDEDLIRCSSPIRLDITQNTTVDVTVSNVTTDGVLPVEGRLQYTYKLKKNRPTPVLPPHDPPPV